MECIGIDRACVRIRATVRTRALGDVTITITARMDTPGFCPFDAGARGAIEMIDMMRRLG